MRVFYVGSDEYFQKNKFENKVPICYFQNTVFTQEEWHLYTESNLERDFHNSCHQGHLWEALEILDFS